MLKCILILSPFLRHDVLILQTIGAGRASPAGRGAPSGRGSPAGRGAPSGRGKAVLPRGMQPIAMKKQDGMLVPEGKFVCLNHFTLYLVKKQCLVRNTNLNDIKIAF